jgi:hypothetical protein
MPQSQEQRKSIRVVAQSNASRGILKTVNIKTVKKNEHAEYLQLTAAQAAANPNKFPTVMDSGGQFPDVPTIVISGYTAPN